MCERVKIDKAHHAHGTFLKGNEPGPQTFVVLVAPCECGTVWWARVPNGIRWVEAEKTEKVA